MSSRREFLAASALTGVALAGASTAVSAGSSAPLAHIVFFWLKNPDSEADRDQLIAGLKTLEQIPQVRGTHIGVPASTEIRDVVDNSFSVSEVLFFDDAESEKAYQVHPIHQAFVENNAHLWERVVVYDTLAV